MKARKNDAKPKKTRLRDDPPAQPPPPPLPPDIADKVLLLTISGMTNEALFKTLEELGIAEAARAPAIEAARQRIIIAANWQKREQTGTAIVRLNDLYRRALTLQDTKTALAAQRELNKLLDLYRPQPAQTEQRDPELDAARAHLAPFGPEGAPLVELARLAAAKATYGNL